MPLPLPPTPRSVGGPAPAADMNLVVAAVAELQGYLGITPVFTTLNTYFAQEGAAVLADASSNVVNVYLPLNPIGGTKVLVKKWDSTANKVYVWGQGGALVEFDPYADIVSRGAGGVFVYYSGNWYLMGPTRDPGSTQQLIVPSVDDIPAVPNAWDEEFNRDNIATIPSTFSWVNQSTSTYLERYGAAVITIPQSTLNARAIAKTMPTGAAWDIVTKVTISAQRATNYNAAFIGLRNPAGQLYMLWCDHTRGFFNIAFNSPTSFNSQGATIGFGHPGPGVYLRIRRNSATSYDMGVSRDGLAYGFGWTGLNPFGVTTWDQIIIGCFTESNDAAGSAAFHYLRKVA